jgi:hypothetical protein
VSQTGIDQLAKTTLTASAMIMALGGEASI